METKELLVNLEHEFLKKIPLEHQGFINLNEGVSHHILNQAEKKIGLTLPIEFKNVYLNRNGQESHVLFLFDEFRLWDIEQILTQWKITKELSKKNSQLYLTDPQYAQSSELSSRNLNIRWIAIGDDGGASQLCLDLDPGKLGKFGQLLIVDNEGEPTRIIAKSILDFLKNIFEGIKNSTLSYDVNSGSFTWS